MSNVWRRLLLHHGISVREFGESLRMSYSEASRNALEWDFFQIDTGSAMEIERALLAKPGSFVKLVQTCRDAMHEYYQTNHQGR